MERFALYKETVQAFLSGYRDVQDLHEEEERKARDEAENLRSKSASAVGGQGAGVRPTGVGVTAGGGTTWEGEGKMQKNNGQSSQQRPVVIRGAFVQETTLGVQDVHSMGDSASWNPQTQTQETTEYHQVSQPGEGDAEQLSGSDAATWNQQEQAQHSVESEPDRGIAQQSKS